MASLRDMAIEYGIDVPIIACAGEGDIVRAGGTVDGIVPALNLYPNIDDYEFEDKLQHYYKELNKLGYPLCVTETHRMHFVLRYLLCSGVKLLGPYNQVGGMDFGFTPAINNWGKPLSFLTHDYGFGGMVTPHGKLTDEYYEGRLLSGFINSLGETLAAAKPEFDHEFEVKGNMKLGKDGVSVLRLKDGGYVLGIINMDDKAREMEIYRGGNKISSNTSIKVDKQRCLMALVDLPLKHWGIDGSINYSSAELFTVNKYDSDGGSNSATMMVFYTDYDAEISLKFGERVSIICENMDYSCGNGNAVFCFKGSSRAKAVITLKDGSRLILSVCSREDATKVMDITSNGDIILESDGHAKIVDCKCKVPKIDWQWNVLEKSGHNIVSSKIDLDSKPKYMEQEGFYRGFAWYGAEASIDATVKGYVIHNASDIISLYVDDRYLGTAIPGGNCSFIKENNPVEKESMGIKLRTEIWGHCNFDDSRLPSLRIDSLKGISGMTIVTNINNLNTNWRYFKGADTDYCIKHENPEDSLRPIINFGSFNNPEQPQAGYYKKKFTVSKETNSWVLNLENLKSSAKVYIDGKFIKSLNDLNTYVVIDEYINAGETHELAIYLEQRYTGESKDIKVLLLEGIKPCKWWIKGAEEKELWQSALGQLRKGEGINANPLILKGGSIGWITGSFDALDADCSYAMKFKGKNSKLTVFANGHMLGRVWLYENNTDFVLAGGRTDVLYLPNCWLNEMQNDVAILAEALKADEDSEIGEVEFECV